MPLAASCEGLARRVSLPTARCVSFTFDLEDHRSGLDRESRYVSVTYRVLEFLSRTDVRGTFFIVGTVAQQYPDLIREIARRGHEVAFHGHDHTPLYLDEPAKFSRQTAASKRFIEDLIGRPVDGYRAPIFSLIRGTAWCADRLAAARFTYSSSILPAANPRNGYAGAPRDPFRWPSGVIELPVPVSNIAGLTVPYLGGVYFRYLPTAVVFNRVLRSQSPALWTYLHPYDCDPDEGFQRVERTNFVESLILWRNRKRTLIKLERLLNAFTSRPLGERVGAGEFADAPTVASLT